MTRAKIRRLGSTQVVCPSRLSALRYVSCEKQKTELKNLCEIPPSFYGMLGVTGGPDVYSSHLDFIRVWENDLVIAQKQPLHVVEHEVGAEHELHHVPKRTFNIRYSTPEAKSSDVTSLPHV